MVDNYIWAKTYSYLRATIVCLLIGLGSAVGYQTWRQDWHLLDSVSAYYYTPAQVVFVGALIGLGACMIALRGTTLREEIFLNLGGVFAVVVAIVPASRGSDYRSAVAFCERAATSLLTERAPTDPDCPSIAALKAATRANVENNLFALVIVGLLGLIVAVLFALGEAGVAWRQFLEGPRASLKRISGWFWFAFMVVFAVWVFGVVALVMRIDWFINNAHYGAAVSLGLCVFLVAVFNARRKLTSGRPIRRYGYASIASAMFLVGIGGFVMVKTKIITVFWLEIVVALIFAVFWTVQTIEFMPDSESKTVDSAPQAADTVTSVEVS